MSVLVGWTFVERLPFCIRLSTGASSFATSDRKTVVYSREIDVRVLTGIVSSRADERDAIQKKTFTKWVNKHLIKANKRVDDLFVDLQDGHSLLSLLEVLSGETLPREKGRMRFHMLQNVQTALTFLRYRKVKLVNIRAEDIVDGNPKLTLGLIWTIILHFQVFPPDDAWVPLTAVARSPSVESSRQCTANYRSTRV
ncbi:hypothetical protein HPB51_025973 [Rhipicephalus microplus]|uniref:Calponin-homology (CH) domain-containing protein n=1 Tax=Rhipicephalus microplus TaxID=6941 RepID=A0A9J6EET1_RHIMP|nr:hypothetical protein HPB51_025973 [Rhipicephalus microplus]